MPKLKVMILVMVMSVITLLAGCGQKSSKFDDFATNNVKGSKDDNEKTKDSSNNKGIPKEDIKVGVVFLTDVAADSGYDFTHDLGIRGMQSNLGLSDDQFVRKVSVDEKDHDKSKKAIQELVDDGCNIIFTTSWGFMDVTEEMAKKYPDIYFCHGTGYKSNGKNFTNYFGRIYQARYLSGIVAGMKTKTNKVGYVAAQDSTNSEVTGGIDAFAMGVASVNPDAKVYVKVTYSWYNPEAEKAASLQLLDMGCDVLGQHCDTSYPQTLAQERGVYGIGYNADMGRETPDSCLCSVVWNWSAYYTSQVQSIIDGSYQGKNYYGGMNEGLVGITDLADFCAEGTQEKVDQVKADILSGKFNVFDGEIETNTGEIIGKKNETLDDATITGKINWYFKNVEVVE